MVPMSMLMEGAPPQPASLARECENLHRRVVPEGSDQMPERLTGLTSKVLAPAKSIAYGAEMGWMPLSPDGIAMCETRGVEAQAEGEGIHGRS